MASLVSVFAAMRLTNVPSILHTLCAMPYLPSVVPQDGTKDGCTMRHALCGILFGGPTFLWMTPCALCDSNVEIRVLSLKSTSYF